jgi:exocyst complex component 4
MANHARIAEILQTIQQEWDFMASDDCIPVQVGLQLMDSSTLGQANREPEFLDTNKKIQRALRSIVNGEYGLGIDPVVSSY